MTVTAEPRSDARTFDDDAELLTGVLAHVIRSGEGEQALELHERSVALARRARDGDEAAADELAQLAAELDLPRVEVLIRSLTRFFQLLNLAEDNERVRRLLRRDAEHGPMHNHGSIRDGVRRLAE